MTSAALAPVRVRPRAINPWVVAVAVVIPTFMEVLDTTIANVALRYIAGGLSAAVIDSEWVLTSYLAANATILPISGWIWRVWAAATTFSCQSRSSPLPRGCAEWPPAWGRSSCSG